MTVMISLVGEQPIPNLLPIQHIRPREALFVHTDQTQQIAQRLKDLVQSHQTQVHLLSTDPYDIQRIQTDLRDYIQNQRWPESELLFNLTGGTKTMVLAAYQIAMALRAPFVYLQSEGRQSRLYRYEFGTDEYRKIRDEVLPGLITIDDYLRAHVGSYTSKTDEAKPEIQSEGHGIRPEQLGILFEKAIEEALVGCVDEVKRGVILGGARELDLVVRLRNQVGVIQAKTGEKAKGKVGLDQLNAACARDYLGTYTAKILVINQKWDHTRENLRELAEAWNITVVELPSFTPDSPRFSLEDQEKLRREVRQALGG